MEKAYTYLYCLYSLRGADGGAFVLRFRGSDEGAFISGKVK
jgi:hypothetical protein